MMTRWLSKILLVSCKAVGECITRGDSVEWHSAPYGCFNIAINKTGLSEAVAKWSGQGWCTLAVLAEACLLPEACPPPPPRNFPLSVVLSEAISEVYIRN